MRKGFQSNAVAAFVEPDPYGVFKVEIREVERVEIDLGEGVDAGYMIVGGQLRPLPIGSTLDTEKGKFFWMPGPGFVGEYELVFVIEDEFGMTKKIPVHIKIVPKFSVYKVE